LASKIGNAASNVITVKALGLNRAEAMFRSARSFAALPGSGGCAV
jgi:hypothetical protein